MNIMIKTQAYINENRESFLEELLELLRIPSISADPAYAKDVKKTASMIAAHFRKAGAKNVKLHKTAGHPIVYLSLIHI